MHAMGPSVPALGVCGWKGSGKTTLLEKVIPVLRRRGWKVGAVKNDAHGLEIDRPGKDSDRLFRAGADVLLEGPGEAARRSHREEAIPLIDRWAELPSDYDLILVEGHKSTPLPKIWLAGQDAAPPPPEISNLLAVLPWDGDRLVSFVSLLDEWIAERWKERPVYGGILVGGRSERMGAPKRLMEWQGKPVLERTSEAMELHTGRVVLLGSGTIPRQCGHLTRLPDPPGIEGPMAGLIGAMRWAAGAAWVFVSCDLPLLRGEAIAWLVEQRRPGRWAILPSVVEKRVEPLFALYEPQTRFLLEQMASRGRFAPRRLSEHRSVLSPRPPAELIDSWKNVNSQDDLLELGG